MKNGRWWSALPLLGVLVGCSDDETARAKQTAEPQVVTAFDPGAGELPEGVVATDGRAWVGLAPSGRVVSVDLEGSGQVSAFGELPPPPQDGFMTGLALGPDQRIYAALVSPDPAVTGGIYRLPAGGGKAELFASGPELAFPNGLAFAKGGELFVTDSAHGSVVEIAPDGTLGVWAQHDSLLGQKDFCGPDLNSFDIGANGIALGDDAIWVANNDKGAIVKIAFEPDGSAAEPEIVAGPDCDLLGGADGLARDAAGNAWVAVNRQNRVVRITPAGAIEIVAEGGALDFPASLAFANVAGKPSLLVTSFALGAALSGGQPAPALVALPMD